jgi:hypothetical protein
MAATGGCDTKISGEHLMSEGVLKILAEKQVELSGMPWLKGQKKMLVFAALTANCLCTRHNSLLSPIDVVGAKLFEAIQKCGTTDIPDIGDDSYQRLNSGGRPVIFERFLGQSAQINHTQRIPG